jgi:hypothetical protein
MPQLTVNGTSKLAEVQYFFRLQFHHEIFSLALVSLFSPPDRDLLVESQNTTEVCHYNGDSALQIVDVKAISTVVSMFPDFQVTPEGEILTPENQYVLMEPPLLKLVSLHGLLNDNDNDNGNGNDDNNDDNND